MKVKFLAFVLVMGGIGLADSRCSFRAEKAANDFVTKVARLGHKLRLAIVDA